MTTQYDAIEYVFYLLQNEIPYNILKDMFAQRNIFIDNNFLKQLTHTKNLFHQIKLIYNNSLSVSQFLIFLRQHLMNNQVPNFNILDDKQIFMNFYSDTLSLINNILFSNEQSRESVIKNNLNLSNIHTIVYKYDYYFLGELKSTLPIGNPVNFITLLANDTLISGWHNIPLQILNYRTGKLVNTLTNQDRIIKIIYLPNKNLILVATNFGVRIWHADSFEEMHFIAVGNNMRDMLIVKSMIVTRNYGDLFLQVWDMDTREELKRLPVQDYGFVYMIKLPLEEKILVEDGYGLRTIWNMDTLTIDKILPRERSLNNSIIIGNILIYTLYREIWTTTGVSTTTLIKVFNLSTETEELSLDTRITDNTRAIALKVFPDDNNRIVVGFNNRTLQVWNLKTGLREFNLVMQQFVTPAQNINISFLLDGKIVSSTEDGTIYIWNQYTGHIFLTFKAHESDINVISMLPDGSLISGSEDGTIKIWK